MLDIPHPYCAVPFIACRVLGTETLWTNGDALSRRGFDYLDPQEFATQFSFCVPESPTFSSLEFDLSDQRTLFAERYGGSGIAQHGGGARAGNLGHFQLKGVGRNPLAGESDGSLNGEFHNTGALPLVEAIYEIISSECLGALLPLGPVRCLGLILLGREATFYPPRWDARPAPAAILVRDRCLRPAHFLPNGGFDVRPPLLLHAGGDVERLRRAYAALSSGLGGHKQFVAYLDGFLHRCAEQLAYARFSRLNHAALSASNISSDGRWLDMAGSSILPRGKDYAQRRWMPPFLREKDAPKQIASEWAYTYSKYTGFEIDIRSLLARYERSFQLSASRAAATFLGLSPQSVSDIDGEVSSQEVADVLDRLVVQGSELTKDLSLHEAPLDGPLFRWVSDTFILAAKGQHDHCGARLILQAIRRPLSRAPTASSSFATELGASLVRAVRPILYGSYFYRARITGKVSAFVLTEDLSRTSEFVGRWLEASGWIYDPASDDPVIVRTDGLTMRYLKTGAIEVRVADEQRVFDGDDRFALASSMLSALPHHQVSEESATAYPPVPEYDFRPAALAILALLQQCAVHNTAAGNP